VTARAGSTDALAERIKQTLDADWLPRIYRERILPLRTRSYQLPQAKSTADVVVQHTLLGVELKIGHRRLSCPDLATARYLSVFARLGCTAVAVPYDITRTSPFADELESSWQRMLLLIEHEANERSRAFRARVRRLLLSKARAEIEQAGAGTAIPQFNQNTKQRSRRT
ncbi:MAG TPA: hypothetical protein VE821_03515, partial [Pyrinomonadaceae bacterium]|nr:hypothetical protein [Pyrinomonadaceae bacterium]